MLVSCSSVLQDCTAILPIILIQPIRNFNENMVFIQRPRITVRIQNEVLALRTYFYSYLGSDKARSASGRLTARDAPHTESGVLNS